MLEADIHTAPSVVAVVDTHKASWAEQVVDIRMVVDKAWRPEPAYRPEAWEWKEVSWAVEVVGYAFAGNSGSTVR